MTQKNLLQAAGDGTAVPSGYVGETLSITSNSDALQSNPVQGNFYDLGPSLVITAGKWLVTFSILSTATRSSGTGATYMVGSIRDSSNTVLYSNYYSINSGFAENWAGFSGSFVLTTNGTTLKQTLQINQLGAVNTYSALYNRGSQVPLYITAVRIA